VTAQTDYWAAFSEIKGWKVRFRGNNYRVCEYEDALERFSINPWGGGSAETTLLSGNE